MCRYTVNTYTNFLVNATTVTGVTEQALESLSRLMNHTLVHQPWDKSNKFYFDIIRHYKQYNDIVSKNIRVQLSKQENQQGGRLLFTSICPCPVLSHWK